MSHPRMLRERSTDEATSSFRQSTASRAGKLWLILASGALGVPGTASAEATGVGTEPCFYEIDRTASVRGWEVPAPQRSGQEAKATRDALSELRRRSGLTWDHLAKLFAVSRRSRTVTP